jgi:peptide/nickel transport system ATP-binding protein
VEEPELAGEEAGHAFACWHPVDGPAPSTGVSVPATALLTVTGRPEASTLAADGAPGTAAAGAVAGANGAPADVPLLEITNLVKEYPVTHGLLQRKVGAVHAVSDVTFSIRAGETFGLVGESGCGKTTIGKVVVALERPTTGEVRLRGKTMSGLRRSELRQHRRDLQLMFQDPYSSLDPRMRVGSIIREPLEIQHLGSRQQQLQRVNELLDEVGLPRNAVERYPHEFSGGQRQRIGLARALTLNPRVIVADEPVSALDVSIRAQVLNLMKRLQADHGLTYVVISHDLAVVKYMADNIGVMYLGKLVELGPADGIYQRAAHPYTAGLIAAIPEPEPRVAGGSKQAVGVKGELPSAINPPSGCRFRTRCPLAQEICVEQEPQLRPFGPGHVAACHFPLQTPVPATAEATTPASSRL